MCHFEERLCAGYSLPVGLGRTAERKEHGAKNNNGEVFLHVVFTVSIHLSTRHLKLVGLYFPCLIAEEGESFAAAKTRSPRAYQKIVLLARKAIDAVGGAFTFLGRTIHYLTC